MKVNIHNYIDPILSSNTKNNISKWKYKSIDNSISTKLLTPFWNFSLQNLVPLDVAPNILTLSGLLCLIYAWYISYLYIDIYPTVVTIASVILVYAYQTFDALDGKQARRTGNSSPLGELFDHMCDNIGVVFLVLTLCNVIGITYKPTIWFLINLVQIGFVTEHVKSLKSYVVQFDMFTGPGEAIIMATLIMILGYFIDLSQWLNGTLFYYCVLASFGYSLAILVSNINKLNKNYITQYRLLLSIVIRFIPSLIIMLGAKSITDITLMDFIADGMILSIITTETIIAKMGDSCIHQWLPILMGLSLFDNIITIIIVIIYHCYILHELTQYLNIYMFTINRNVYIDGVFDLCHVGHVQLFDKALQHGNRLIVGVLPDEDVIKYKREPIMNYEERCRIVKLWRPVYKVIKSSPLTGITEEFIKEHNIHAVVYSEEYDDPTNEMYSYYDVPRKMGISISVPRTKEISTSNLIKRIQSRKTNTTEQTKITKI